MAGRRGRIVVVGSLNLDHTVTVDALPRAGQTVAGRDYATAAGGKGLNQAVAAARLGGEVTMVGAVGDDAAGGLLAGVLADEGIGTAGLLRRSGASGTALVTVGADGTNTIVVAAGANGTLRPEDLDADLFAGAAVVLCQLEIPGDVVQAALRAGREAGAMTVLNPAPAAGALPGDLLGLVDLLVPNETEAAALTGGKGAAGSVQAERAARDLCDAGAGAVVVTLGAAGALLVEKGTVTPVAAVPVTAVDSTAAGDAFLGALVAGMAAGGAVADVLPRAAAAGALAASRPGAVPSLPSTRQVDDLLSAGVSPGARRSRPRSGGARPGGPRRPRRP